MVQALFATCKHILYGIENDKNEMGKLFKIIKRAMLACENSGHDVSCDFPEVRKIVEAGATTKAVAEFLYESKLDSGQIWEYGEK